MLSLVAFAVAAPVVNLSPISFTEVKIHDKFWAPRMETNRKVSIPHSLKMLEESGTLRNFEVAAKRERTGFTGLVFMDSDAYKALEGACYSLANHPDPALEKQIDAIVAKIAAAQMPDGYLNTYYQINAPDKRFTNLADNHELYCVGHMYEAAVAHYRVTKRKNFLDIATKNADLLVKTFGPKGREGYCGHPEIELALVKLAEATGNKDYFDLARHFVETRGTHFFARERKQPEDRYDGTYWLDDVPIFDHKNIKGHAVRACYLFSGVTDIASATKDPRLLSMLDKVWSNTTYKRMYVTGGIGPSASNEGFTTDYDLPNETAYQETCASIALLQWNHRMGLLYGQSKYWDETERSLYNGFLAGVNLAGDLFFYVNPLASQGRHHRRGWFACACCPPNVTRTLASLGQYAYAKSNRDLYVNLFVDSTVQTRIGAANPKLKVATNYPWDGKVTLTPTGFGSAGLKIRIPAWSPRMSSIAAGRDAKTTQQDGYLSITGLKDGATIAVEFEMPVQRVAANPAVKENQGRAAVQRGPIIYCLEQAGASNDPLQAYVPMNAPLTPEWKDDLLGGVTVLKGFVHDSPRQTWTRSLYQPASATAPIAVQMIPYYAWDNREPGGMAVWLPTAPRPPVDGGLEQSAKVSMSFVGQSGRPEAVRDGKPITKSNIHPGALAHFWPHKGTSEWIQYTWAEPQEIGSTRLYWFDDTGYGECRLPDGYEIQYQVGDQWKPVKATFPNKLDEWLVVPFEPIKTKALRLVIKMKSGFAAGIHEWRVDGVD